MRKARFLAALCATVPMCGFATSAYAGGGEETEGADLWEGLNPAATALAPTPDPEQKPFTFDGTRTVVDNATDEEGKEFFTITTAEEAMFYLVIDRQKSAENVYFLNAVTLADLATLAESIDGAAPITPTPEPEPEPEPEAKGGAGPFPLELAVLLIGGGAARYFKIYRPKYQQVAAPAEDYDEADTYDGPEDYGDGPPWDEDEPNDGEPEE